MTTILKEHEMKVTKYEPEINSLKDNKKKLRVAAYCRVSTDEDEQLNSYQSMISYYKSVISENPDWVLYKIYADEGSNSFYADDYRC